MRDQMATDTASIWSAVAATFSAIAAITIVLIQRLNRIDSSRPEIILDGWSRIENIRGKTKRDILSFSKILNAGKGSALHISINANKISENLPLVMMSTKQVSIIPSEAEIKINSDMILYWENIKPLGDGGKSIQVDIRILFWCRNGYLYETMYRLFIAESASTTIFGGTEVAPGVTLVSRHSIMQSVWKLKLYNKLAFLGRYVPKINKKNQK